VEILTLYEYMMANTILTRRKAGKRVGKFSVVCEKIQNAVYETVINGKNEITLIRRIA
jgi:uncharacterized membrane protein YjdF